MSDGQQPQSEPDVMICQHNKRLSECEFCVPMIEDAARRALQPLGDFTVLAATPSEPSEAKYHPSSLRSVIETGEKFGAITAHGLGILREVEVILSRPLTVSEEVRPAPPAISRAWLASLSDAELDAIATVLELEAEHRLNVALEGLAGRSEGDGENG